MARKINQAQAQARETFSVTHYAQLGASERDQYARDCKRAMAQLADMARNPIYSARLAGSAQARDLGAYMDRLLDEARTTLDVIGQAEALIIARAREARKAEAQARKAEAQARKAADAVSAKAAAHAEAQAQAPKAAPKAPKAPKAGK